MTDKRKDKPEKKVKPARTNEETGSGFTLSLGCDKSLEAYKAWINRMTLGLNPNAKSDMTEEQWVENWKEFWAEDKPVAESTGTNEKIADGASESTTAGEVDIEASYPGITKQIQQYAEAEYPACPLCGSSARTARVSYGIIGRSITMSASTPRIKLSAKPGQGAYFCHACSKFFDQAEKA